MAGKIHWSLLALTALSGCGAPFGDKLAIDYEKKQIAGSIMVSDAKPYRREALINERRNEINYIDKMMAETEKVDFTITPDIVREVEIIQSLALNAGISFDPAAGLSYRDSSSNAAIQQKITALGLQMQLDQLEGDAKLFRAGLEKQTELANKDVGKLADPSAPVAAPTLTQADASALVTRIDALQKTLADRLGATVAGPRAVTLKGNPIDQFRDRAAYRQVLTTARNSASLDELHDRGGAALYRLSFQVTTLPPQKDYRRTAGIVQMAPAGQTVSDEEMQEIFSQWLQYVNSNLTAGGKLQTGESSIADFSVANRMATPMRLVAPATPAEEKAGTCNGLFTFDDKINCAQSVTFFIPNLQATTTGGQRQDVLIRQFSNTNLATLDAFFAHPHGVDILRSADVSSFVRTPGQCRLKAFQNRQGSNLTPMLQDANAWVNAAVTAYIAVPVLGPILDQLAAQFAANVQVSKVVREQQVLVRENGRKAGVLLQLLVTRDCALETLIPETTIVVPFAFSKLVNDKSRVRVYEVGPREQVQQVSTAARAAEAFSMALALTAKAPQAGTAANAGLGYSRSAIGKVDVIERQPIVIGYAQAGDAAETALPVETLSGDAAKQALAIKAAEAAKLPKFGWILGPRIDSIDPKKSKFNLEQGQKPYDLSVDLTVSGWRTRLPLLVRTAWAPDWRTSSLNGAMDINLAPTRTITVELAPSAAEFADLTRMLAFGPGGGSVRFAAIDDIRPHSIKACSAATLVITGTGLWRTTDVVVGATRIASTGIAVLPDMRGIMVEIPKGTDLGSARIDLQLLTPYGVARPSSPLLIDGYDGKGCTKPDTQKSPNVSLVAPKVMNHATKNPLFILTGTDLEKVTRVTFGIAEGTLETVKTGATTRKVTFTSNDLQRVGTEFETLTVFAGKENKDVVTTEAIRLSTLFSSSGKE